MTTPLSQALNSILGGNWNNAKPLDNVVPGLGFNSFSGQTMAQALDSTAAILGPGGQGSQENLISVETITELMRSLDLSVNAGYSTLGFSADDNLDFLDQSSVNSYDFFAVAYLKIRLPSKILNGGDFIQQAQGDAAAMDEKDFFQKYGDSFVSRIDYGGDLFGLLHVQCQTVEQKTLLVNSLTVGGFNLTLATKVANLYQSMSQVSNVQVVFMKTGGTASFVDATTFQNALQSFPNEVAATGGSAVSFGLSPYTIANWPGGANPLANFSNARTWMTQLVVYLQQCQQLLYNANYIVSNPRQFDFTNVTVPALQTEITTLNTTANGAIAQVSLIATDPLSAVAPNLPDLAEITLPNRLALIPPSLSLWVGVYGVAQAYGTSGSFVPSPAVTFPWLDSFGINKPGGPYDLHINYMGRLQPFDLIPAGNPIDVPSQDGGRAAINGGAQLIGVWVSLAGNDAPLFDACYEAILVGGARSGEKKNGDLILAPNGICALNVSLRPRGI